MRRSLWLTLIATSTLWGAQQPVTKVWMTIMVHGTVGLQSAASFSTFFQLLRDDMCDSCYTRIVHNIRTNPPFYHTQAIQDFGLKKIIMPTEHYQGNASSLFALLIDRELGALQPHELRQYYTFGWSGLVSASQRYSEAWDFYRALRKEYRRVKKQFPCACVRIRIIAYSHGGSVALNLATARKKLFPDDTFAINELALFGTPVMAETNRLICDDMFESIYHFYSRNDFIQKLDCFSQLQSFSSRRFNKVCNGKVPQKLTQIELKVSVPSHHRGSCKTCRKEYAPLHSEFWSFGWTPNAYRAYFPLYPIPMAAFTPTLINLIDDNGYKGAHIVLELQPHHEQAIIRCRYASARKTVSWISQECFDELRNTANTYAFDELHKQAHCEHLARARNSVYYPLKGKHYSTCCCCGAGAKFIPECE